MARETSVKEFYLYSETDYKKINDWLELYKNEIEIISIGYTSCGECRFCLIVFTTEE